MCLKTANKSGGSPASVLLSLPGNGCRVDSAMVADLPRGDSMRPGAPCLTSLLSIELWRVAGAAKPEFVALRLQSIVRASHTITCNEPDKYQSAIVQYAMGDG